MPFNYIADKLLRRKAQSDFAITRRNVFFDINNYERLVNDLTGRVTSSQSQRLAVAQGLGLPTAGLIIGGQRDDRDPAATRGQRQSAAREAAAQREESTAQGASQALTKGLSPSREARDALLRGGRRGGQRYGQQDPD